MDTMNSRLLSEFTKTINELSDAKDEAVKRGDPVVFYKIFDQLHEVKLAKRKLQEQEKPLRKADSPDFKFKKALVIFDGDTAVEADIAEADIVITESGQIVKNRWGKLTDQLDNPVLRGTTLAEQALRKLSGDLSNDNVAAAKQILKKILGD